MLLKETPLIHPSGEYTSFQMPTWRAAFISNMLVIVVENIERGDTLLNTSNYE
jgi:hypothetical protein